MALLYVIAVTRLKSMVLHRMQQVSWAAQRRSYTSPTVTIPVILMAYERMQVSVLGWVRIIQPSRTVTAPVSLLMVLDSGVMMASKVKTCIRWMAIKVLPLVSSRCRTANWLTCSMESRVLRLHGIRRLEQMIIHYLLVLQLSMLMVT